MVSMRSWLRPATERRHVRAGSCRAATGSPPSCVAADHGRRHPACRMRSVPPACRCPVARSSVGCHRHVAMQRTRVRRMKLVGAILALQRDARASPAAEVEPHLAVTVAPPLNEREAWSSPEHLCHPNCDRLLCRCQCPRRRQRAGDQWPHRVAARPTQGDVRLVAVGFGISPSAIILSKVLGETLT